MPVLSRPLLLTIRGVVLLFIFLSALSLEAPGPDRLRVLVVVFTAFLAGIHLKELPAVRQHRLYFLTYFLDLALISLLEHNARFAVNYYLHSFYLILLVSAGLDLNRKQALFVNTVILLVSALKFINLLYSGPTPAQIASLIFAVFSAVLMTVVLYYARAMHEEKEHTRRLHRELQEYAARVRELSIAAERNRLAREIHDTLGHSLTALIMELEMCQRLVARRPSEAEEMLEQIKTRARNSLADVRRAVEALHPRAMKNRSLAEAIAELITDFRRHASIEVELEGQDQIPALPPVTSLAVFRAIQEALTNAVRHGQATRVAVRFYVDGAKFCITVEDNGKGASAVKPGQGLEGMRERLQDVNGLVSWLTAPGKGFTLNIELPFFNRGADAISRGSAAPGDPSIKAGDKKGGVPHP